jgi:hypothetical protein
MKARVRLCTLLVLACIVTTPACYRYHLYQVGGPAGRELGNQPGTEWEGKTLHAFAWGLIRQDLPIDNCQTATGERFNIEEVRIETNLLYVLAAAATLGLWVPLDASWRCARPPVRTNR